MKKPLTSACFACLVLLCSTPAGAAFDDLQKAFNAFYQTGLDTENAVGVENLTLQKDVMTLVLKKGILIPMQPIEGEVTGAMFVGEGTASLTAPTAMDAWYLKKSYGSDRLSESFSNLYMRFTDGTEKLFPKPAPGTTQAAVASQIETIKKTFKDRQQVADGWLGGRFDMDMDFLDTRIGGVRGMDYFYAQFQTGKWGWVTFLLNQGDTIEVSLGHDRTVGVFRDFLPWAEFHKQADYKDGRYVLHPSSDTKEIIDVKRTDMNVSIPTTKSVIIDAKLTVTPLVDSLSCLRFDFLNQFGNVSWRDQSRPIIIDAVLDGSGKPLPYLHKRNELLIRLLEPIPKGQSFVVQVKATEDTIQQLTAESYLILNTYPWFPQYGYIGGRYAFDFKIEVQRPLMAMGSGRIVREWENKEERMNGIELRMDEEVQLPSILFGRFLRQRATVASEVSKRNILLSVSAYPTMTVTITDSETLELIGSSTPVTVTLNVPPGKMKGILSESEAIIKFYEQLYGPFPFGDLNVAQMAPQFNFGQSPPSLIQLTGIAFLSQAQLEADFLHGFLSHEIGHQYWGHTVGWASDRDVWLSEAFAEYSAGLYTQSLQGEKRFKQKMDGWRRNARQADSQAPIALATILGGDNAGKYFTQLIYNKGPLVVHMIRMQMGNDNFVKAMTAILTKYRHQNITTEMVSRELSAVTGYNWDYFFDQWFRSVGIPEIHYKYTVTPKDGKYLFEMTVNQKDKDNLKKLFLPIVWKGSGKDQTAQKDFPIGKQGQVIQAMLPFEPKGVEVDPNHNLLADYVMDK